MLASAADSGPGQDSGVAWYSYAILRVVPRVERGEYLNVGIILFARTRGFLEARLALDEDRLRAFAPEVDLAAIRRHLEAIRAICAGVPDAGPIAALSPSERFHWLTAPRSTVIQTSPVHVGCCRDPVAALEELLDSFVRPPRPS
jgi:hypothetical protein